MKNLYAPWRAHYTAHSARNNSDGQDKDSCVFCTQLAQDADEQYFILQRFTHTTIMLNAYPYNAGHLLIISNLHVASLDELGAAGRSELMEVTNTCVELVKKAFGADGVNVGINLGKAAGAGIPSHLHLHVVPRFTGDTNFMPTIAQTKVISFDLSAIYAELKKHVVSAENR